MSVCTPDGACGGGGVAVAAPSLASLACGGGGGWPRNMRSITSRSRAPERG